MSSAVDRTADFIQFVQLASRANSRLPNGEIVLNRPSDDILANGTQVSTSLFTPTLQPDHEDVQSFSATLHTNRPMRSETRRNDRQALVQRSEFMQMAASIGRDLASTFGKLEKLNNLARRQSLFDDHSTEVQHMTYIVKEDMADLNHRIATLQSMSKSQLTKGKQQARHSRSILMGLQTRLANMSNQFRGLLEQRSENIRTQAARRGKYTAMQKLDSGDTFISGAGVARPVIPTVLLEDDEQARHNVLHAEDGLAEGIRHTSEPSTQLATQQRQLYLTDQTEAYLTSRADTMRSIEHTIVELGEIFQQLATMVHEQDESIQRIDMNVEEAATSIEAGHSELVRYLRSISSSRWLMIKVFGVLLVFFIIFVVFFV
ncbi:Syntaxin [Paragonimus heterotremus]|uniref:Syntaxin n=1 Tax=Paragonimus heterotremus TaxID=100268 RepID=A0A8J4TAQ4_9TREM|nr:Syntaxin [Paragonimus heterotremus]